MASSSERRRRRTRIANEGGAGIVWVERAWRFVARPAFVGMLIFLAGLALALAPTTVLPETPAYDWWLTAFRFADAVRAAATLLAAAAVIGLGMAVARIRQARGPERRAVASATVAVVLMGAGIVWGAMGWLTAQADLPTSRVAVAPGQPLQAYPATFAGRTFNVMLPQRVTVESVDAQQGRAVVELSRAGTDEAVRNDVYVGDPLPVGDTTVALLGVELDPRVLSAILTTPGGIEVRATKGEKIRFEPDGAQYDVLNIVRDYVGAMGPAVELASEETGRFWAFERDAKLPEPMTEVRMLRLETAPVAVLAFAPKRNDFGSAPAGLLFVLGLALFLLARDRSQSSLHEAGLAGEST